MEQQILFDIMNINNLINSEKENTNVKSSKSKYNITKNKFLNMKFAKLSEDKQMEWKRDKKNPSKNGIIFNTIADHKMIIISAIDAGRDITDEVLKDYEDIRILFKEELLEIRGAM